MPHLHAEPSWSRCQGRDSSTTSQVPCRAVLQCDWMLGHTNAGLYIEPFLAGQEVVRLSCGYWMIGHLWDWNAYAWSGKWSSGVTHAQNSCRFCTLATNSYAQALWSYKMNANLHQSMYIQHRYSIDYLIPCVNVCHLDEISVCSKKSLKLKHRGEIYVIAFITK